MDITMVVTPADGTALRYPLIANSTPPRLMYVNTLAMRIIAHSKPAIRFVHTPSNTCVWA